MPWPLLDILHLDQRDRVGHGLKTQALLALARPEDALAAAGESIGLDPRDPVGYGLKAQALLVLGRPDDAWAPAGESIRLNPRDQ